FQIDDSGDFNIPAVLSTARIAENNFPMTTYQSDIIKTPAPVLLHVDDVSAYYDNALHTSVPQGHQSVAFLKLGFWTREFQGVLDKIRFTRLGTSSDVDVSNIRLYLDGLNGTDGDGLFEPAADTLINSTVVQFSTSSAVLDIQPNITLDGTTKYIF